MGSKCSVFINKSNVEIELRVFLPPSRPDRYKKIIRIKPGEWKLLSLAKLCCVDSECATACPIYLMVFIHGVYTGMTFYPFHIRNYAKILGYRDNNDQFNLKGIRMRVPAFCSAIRQKRPDVFVD